MELSGQLHAPADSALLPIGKDRGTGFRDGWVGPEVCVGGLGEQKISSPARIRTPNYRSP